MDIRTVGSDDLSWCQQVFNESFEDLHRRFGIHDEPAPDDEWLRPILTHFLETDPSGMVGAIENSEPVAFASSFRRDEHWFLSFLFVRPSVQGRGIGRALLEELVPSDPTVVRATVVESFQPVSTGLYASYGLLPRTLKYWLTKIARTDALPSLGALRRAALTEDDRADVDHLDRSVLGFERSDDHAWWISADTPAWSYRREGDLVAYAYIDDGFIGPVLADTEDTLCAVVADQLRSADDPSVMAVNLCANSESLFRMLIDAGARIDPDPPYRFVYCATDGPLPASYIHHSDWLP